MSTLPWPEHVSELVNKFILESGTNVTLREPLLQGKSGAFVAIVDCKGKHDGVYVLKVTPVSTEYADEEARYQKAIATAAFSRTVPPLVGQTRDDHNHLLLMRLAGGSRIEWRPLVESLRLFGAAYSKLASVLWSPEQFQWIDGAQPPSEIARALGYRLKPNEGGRILANVSRDLSSELLLNPELAHRGQILPNPLHFAINAGSYSGPPVALFRGSVHGDCHSGNVFIKAGMDAEVSDIAVIDLGCFETESMVFFDQSYFELATLLHQFEDVGEDRWSALAAALANESKADALDHLERGWVQDIQRGRESLFRLAHDTWPDRRDDLKIQFLSAQVAAGLAFLNKVPRRGASGGGLSTAQYRQAFVWAGLNLRRLLQVWPAERPPRPEKIPVLSAPAAESLGPSGITNDQWQAVDGFDAAGLNVLVLSRSARKLHRDALVKLMRVEWGLVIDFATSAVDDAIFGACRRAARQHWPGSTTDARLVDRGTLWYFANGREDLSGAEPSKTDRDWRRIYGDSLRKLLAAIDERLSPASVRVLILQDDPDGAILLRAGEQLDEEFDSTIRPIFVASADPEVEVGDLDVTKTSLEAILDKLASKGDPADVLQNSIAVMPRRVEGGTVRLDAVPPPLVGRVERDLVMVGLHRASQMPAGRVFGIDFRRGQVVEWSELAHQLDVKRDLFAKYRKILDDKLAASNNETVNLLHEPSAGGSTISRRLAWSLMDRYPVVLVRQVSGDTATYLRDVFQHCALPVLVVMEAEVVTESDRETLLRQLREDNTRAVFLWVRRTYAKNSNPDVVPAKLSKSEATEFMEAYLDQVSDETRRSELRKLATSADLADQRSPFFFGLTAFGEDYLGLSRLIDGVLVPMSRPQRSAMAQLALASVYTSEGMPVEGFDQVCRAVGLDRTAIEARSSFLLTTKGYVRIPHVLIAQRTLQFVARNRGEWKADLHLHAGEFLDEAQKLKLRGSRKIRGMIETLFFTRDLVAALESDADAQSGSLPRQGRFSPLIQDLGSVELARQLLSRITNAWPSEFHFAVHYARHLLYEEPKDTDKAIRVATQAAQTAGGSKDHSVIHMVGMCYRVRMEQRLNAAWENRQQFDDVAAAVAADYKEAISYFANATELQPASEYGHVATIQMIRRLLDGAMKVTGQALAELVAPSGRRWLMDALASAEDHIEQINLMSKRKLSIRAQRTIAEWHLVYGNHDQVIAKLRVLAQSHEDTDVRRALCRAIVAKHHRKWTTIPRADLLTIKTLTERNMASQGVRDADVRIWLRAVRNMGGFDIDAVIRALVDWHHLQPRAVEPTFYLYAFYFVRWLNSKRSNQGLAKESSDWLEKTRANRSVGERSWSYEWLGLKDSQYYLINHADLPFDPISYILDVPERPHLALDRKKALDAHLTRVEGIVSDYKGPTQAKLDLAQRVKLRFTPHKRIVKDDVGKAATAFVSFAYDDLVGWDVELKEK